MDTRLSFDMFVPTRVSCGRPVWTNGYLACRRKQLQNAGVEYVMFDRVEANPLKDTVRVGSRVARETDSELPLNLSYPYDYRRNRVGIGCLITHPE